MKRSPLPGVVRAGAFVLLAAYPIAAAFSQASGPGPTASPPASHGLAFSSHDPGSVNLEDADSILRIAVPKTIQNRRQSMAYTYEISYRNRNYTSGGKMIADYKARYEVIFVEGLPYRRQIEENQKPLSNLQAAEEQRRYDEAFAERRVMSIDQKRDYLRRPWNVDVPLPQLSKLFTNRVVGEETVDGRPSIVVESVPRDDAHPSDEEERRALHKQVKLWIDREDLIVSRLEAELVADDAAMKKGTVARIDFERRDGVWLPVHSDVQFRTMDGAEVVRGQTTESNEDFHRFRVDVRILAPAQAGIGEGQAQ
jgi:hypothetical protein